MLKISQVFFWNYIIWVKSALSASCHSIRIIFLAILFFFVFDFINFFKSKDIL